MRTILVFLSQRVYILASRQLITLAIEVCKLRIGSKVKGDFLLQVPAEKKQTRLDACMLKQGIAHHVKNKKSRK